MKRMVVAFDNSVLCLALGPDGMRGRNPEVDGERRHQVNALIEELRKSKCRIIIPTPCLSEILVLAPDAEKMF